jgi:hypothetical protein
MTPTTAKLSSLLTEFGASSSSFGLVDVRRGRAPISDGFEIKQSRHDSKVIYLGCPSLSVRHELQDFLRIHGVSSVERNYWKAGSVMQVRIR